MTPYYQEKAENLRKLLEQHWLHCRHLESERAWFMNVYMVAMGGVLTLIAFKGPVSPLPFYFLIWLTFSGFFHTLRWTYAFECHRKKVNELIRILWSETGVKTPMDPTMDIPPMFIVPERFQKVGELFRTRYWFPFFYFIILLGFVFYFIIADFSPLSVWMAIAALVFASILGVRWYFSLRKVENVVRVVIEGCNGEWSQEHYLPFLVKKAEKGDIELWAIDIKPRIQWSNHSIAKLWRSAQSKGKVCYLNKNQDKEYPEKLPNADFVFITAPDRYHCKIAEFWLERLSSSGRIFIEKPLDASVEQANEFKEKLGEHDAVYGFDHYLATAQPFLKDKVKYLKKIGEIKEIEFYILEHLCIPPNKKNTLKEGMIFDLFCHILALVGAVVDQNLTQPKIKEVKAARYRRSPISRETFASIKFFIDGTKITSAVGKCVGKAEDKVMIILGSKGKIKLDFHENKFSVLDIYGGQSKEGKLEPSHVESFLEAILRQRDPRSVPGVLSFDTDLEILKVLDEAKKKIGKMLQYSCKESIDEILRKF